MKKKVTADLYTKGKFGKGYHDEISKVLFEMQMKLDEHNQTVEFDVDIE